MAEQKTLAEILATVDEDTVKSYLKIIEGAEEGRREETAQALQKALMGIGTEDAATQQLKTLNEVYVPTAEAMLQADINSEPYRRGRAEFDADLGTQIRSDRADIGLKKVQPLLDKMYGQTANRDAQQERMLGTLVDSREKLAGQRNMTNKLNMLKDLGLGAMIMFGN